MISRIFLSFAIASVQLIQRIVQQIDSTPFSFGCVVFDNQNTATTAYAISIKVKSQKIPLQKWGNTTEVFVTVEPKEGFDLPVGETVIKGSRAI